VSWKSQDGAALEGVLRKAPGYVPGQKRPLLVLVHGGPTGTSRPSVVGGNYVYPAEPFLAKGALILDKPKAVRAALEQNLSWFAEHVLDVK
jgi:dipeptidyl aminopeptidase/acylaminoacyl peptidase